MEGLNRFAHDKVHRKAWEWYYGEFVGKLGFSHLGIYHEAFEARAGKWEVIGQNMPSTLLTAASAPVENAESGKREWVSTIVDASATYSGMKTQWSKLGRTLKGKEEKQK